MASSLGSWRALIALAAAAAYARALRPRMLRWGATAAEVEAAYPGADVIPGGRRGATMATTIGARPSQVWPWLVQMGCDRAGWYSIDALDNGGRPSATEVHPKWQQISVGDRLASTPGGSAWFEVAALEPRRFLALRAPLDLRRGRPFSTSGPRPPLFSDSLWGFRLDETPEHDTRLVVSGYAASRPRLLTAIGDVLFWEPAHWLMHRHQLTNLKRRIEAAGAHDGAPGRASAAAHAVE